VEKFFYVPLHTVSHVYVYVSVCEGKFVHIRSC